MDEADEMNYSESERDEGQPMPADSSSRTASGTANTAAAVALLPTAEQLEIAESILGRLNPNSKSDIDSMIHRKGQVAGLVLASLVLFWWLSVLNLGSNSEYNDFTSLISSLSFMTVAWLLPILVFFGSLLNAAGRHRGKPAPSLFAGIFFLICIFFASEPIVRTLAGSGDFNTGASQSIRLLILGFGTFFSAKLFIESFLLDWVKKLQESFQGIALAELAGHDQDGEDYENSGNSGNSENSENLQYNSGESASHSN